jgi:Bacterial capsule synthesis protein PGA_cap
MTRGVSCRQYRHTRRAASQPIGPAGAQARRRDLTIVVGGDVGLNSSNLPVDAKGIYKRGFQPWADTTSAIARDISSDINFMNLETVVTDRNDLAPDLKVQSGPFNFRMHPEGLRHLVSRGFNLISLANNHSMDFGVPGLKEAPRNIDALRGKGILAAPALG